MPLFVAYLHIDHYGKEDQNLFILIWQRSSLKLLYPNILYNTLVLWSNNTHNHA